MYVIIVGASKIGTALARILSENRQNVVVVEKLKDKAKSISEEIDATVINGSGTDIDVLQDAGAEEADVIVAATSDDAVNFMVCELAKILGIERRISLGLNPKHEKIFREADIEEVIYSSSTIARYIGNLITRPGARSVLTVMPKGSDIVEVVIPEKGANAGKKIRDIGMPQDSTIAAIYREKDLVIPGGDTEVKAGDRLIILAKDEAIEKIADQLTKK